MLSNRSSPALVSAVAASKLPRWALLALLVVFILPQLFSTVLWSGRDLTSFGVAWSMLNGDPGSWLFPNVDGAYIHNIGPLTAWIGALSMATLGRVIDPVAAFHLTSGIWFSLLTASVWYSTYLLSRRDEAQPLAFIFGGEAARKDYGRMVADIATLLLVGTYGLVLVLHEVTPQTTLLALAGVLSFGVILGLENCILGSVITGLACGAAVMTSSIGTGIWFTLAAWVAIFFTPNYTSRSRRAFISITVAIISALVWPLLAFILYPTQATQWFSQFVSASISDFTYLPLSDYVWLAKNFAWATLPAWPFAIYAVYAWRRNIRSAHLAVPCAIISIAFISILFTGVDARSTMLCVMPSMVMLAAFGIVSIKRSKENVLDLFSGIVFTLGLIAMWAYFFAWYTGAPTKMAFSITRLAPEVPQALSVSIIGALLFSLLWIYLLVWRFFRHPVFLWRGAWIAACGVTASWVVAISLFGPLINGARSMNYTQNAFTHALEEIQTHNGCISGDQLSLSDRAAFNYHVGIHFAPLGDKVCRYELVVSSHNKHSVHEDHHYTLASVLGRPRSGIIYRLRLKQD